MAAVIEDGMYFLHPEGSAWIGARFSSGKCTGIIYESNADTHAAARDQWAGMVPTEDDEEIDGDMATAIIREVMSEDTMPELVVVTRQK